MNIKHFFLYSALIIMVWSCKNSGDETNLIPLARVHDQILYSTYLDDLIPAGLSEEDSSRIARRLIEEWTRNKLFLYQAELNLPEEQKDIEKQVEEYRSSLLTFRYKQLILQENLNEKIDDQEIESYYSENLSNYILDSDLVQLRILKIPVSSPQISDVRLWYRSDREDYVSRLKAYAENYAVQYSIDDSTWVYFRDIVANTPLNIDNIERYLNYNRNIELSDSSYYYFIKINNRLKEGDIKPLALVKDNIRSVILNKRKIEFIQDLENTVYKEGISRNQIEIY
ncbi:MAG: hypothetical protein K9H49_15385 [Bacteroidales bacterium]|nr:hypothetical protein [Bacteroidales bacterium]MCF8391190.1 hypothetical protein [Bacteroidales bacterium]